MTELHRQLDAHAASLRRSDRLAWAAAVALLGLGALAAGRVHLLALPIIGLLGFAGAALAWRRAERRYPLTATAVARTLDATVPGVQASSALALRAADTLPTLQQLQLARIAPVVTESMPQIRVPRARRTAPLALAACGMLLGIVGFVVPPLGGATTATASAVASTAAVRPAAPRVTALRVRIVPPRYTGRPMRFTSDLDLEVESGSTVQWLLEVAGTPPTMRLATSDRDTLALVRAEEGRFVATVVADHPLLYDFVGQQLDGLPQGAHRLAVIPDRAPVITIVRPDERTTIESGEPLTVPVEVLGRDDYGIARAEIVATVTTGSGENVKFREQRLGFSEQRSRGNGAMLWRTTLDLEALGVKPGDELYFHVIATDRRAPTPNEGRSETIFIRRADTTRAALAEFSGLALKVTPDYFRSQRQIIIDTEKLLAEQKSLPLERFRERSNEIGIDQHLLRVRYGELVGDENESGLGSVVAEQLESIGIETGEPHAHADVPQAEQLGPKVAALPDDAVHRHDDSENATRLASSVKATLQDALREMWSAERHLRTYDPRTALPYEYRALEFLKQVQQAARVYVKRVGFEPPPLEPEKKRLTGKQDAIRDVNRGVSQASRDRYPAVRALLADWPSSATPDAVDRRRVQAAGEELAREALERPGTHLDALRMLRRWLDDGAQCAACNGAAQALVYAAVPAPAPSAAAKPPRTAAERAYADRVRALP